MYRVNYIGKVYGRLTVISNSYIDSSGSRVVDVQCSCGNRKSVPISNIKRCKSCGCYSREVASKGMKDNNQIYRDVWLKSDKPSKNNKSLGIKNIYRNKTGGYVVSIDRKGVRFRKRFKSLHDAIAAKTKFLEDYEEGRL